MADTKSFDPVWSSIYAGPHEVRYPWDAVVSFVMRFVPKERARRSVRILEVGCGTASNLWFAAREGFSVAGVDAAPAAIEKARTRFSKDGLSGDLRVADFTSLPFDDGSFDLVIDRGSLTCAGLSDALAAISEIERVIAPGGAFFFNPYSVRHTSAKSGTEMGNGLVADIRAGSMVGVGQICFYTETNVREALAGWSIRSLVHVEAIEVAESVESVHAEWRVIAERL